MVLTSMNHDIDLQAVHCVNTLAGVDIHISRITYRKSVIDVSVKTVPWP